MYWQTNGERLSLKHAILAGGGPKRRRCRPPAIRPDGP
ncbi:hypothetical protein BN2497_3433 [Janthinobacterium sp. CG23_2]|nr:hypothetical protein BN2497_3433 [Janthinobacterium sp. CG23_2]CUU28114.1 hypothetical protein BN3177_3433 [Janthinobacterium sp. CG23_2]